MTALLPLALLAAAASAGLSAPWWLLVLILVWLASGKLLLGSGKRPAMTQPAEEVIAVIYVRAGKLVLRRRKGAA